jgi:membrane-associated phospholipid phosphatase
VRRRSHLSLLVAVHAAAFSTSWGLTADRRALGGFTALNRPRIYDFINGIAHLGDPKPFTIFGLVLVAVALVRHRPRVAAAATTILVGANVTTQVLKPALAHARAIGGTGAHVSAASWPSGHATASMSLALCAVLVAPARLRPAVATAGAAFSVAVTFSLLALGWHFPSDVIGGYLIVATWTALAIGAVWAAEARWPRPARPAAPVAVRDALRPALVTAAAALALGAVIALSRPGAVAGYAQEHTTFVVGAGVIAALGLGLAMALALTLRR